MIDPARQRRRKQLLLVAVVCCLAVGSGVGVLLARSNRSATDRSRPEQQSRAADQMVAQRLAAVAVDEAGETIDAGLGDARHALATARTPQRPAATGQLSTGELSTGELSTGELSAAEASAEQQPTSQPLEGSGQTEGAAEVDPTELAEPPEPPREERSERSERSRRRERRHFQPVEVPFVDTRSREHLRVDVDDPYGDGE